MRPPRRSVTLERRSRCELDLTGLGRPVDGRARDSYFRGKELRGQMALVGERGFGSKNNSAVEGVDKFMSQLVLAGARCDKLSQSR